MKPAKNTRQDSSENELQQTVSDDTAEDDTSENVAPRVTALIGMLATGLLYLALPPKLIIGPGWLLLALEVVFVVPLIIEIFTEWELSHMAKRMLVLIPLSVISLALVSGVVLLIVTLPTDKHATNLLRSAALLWGLNILTFALWYWQLDGGGPRQRHLSGHRAADFVFPQQAKGEKWAPQFLDYLFLAFTGATALSPADTNPLTRLAKMLMMIEAILSLTIIGVIAARAVNILGS